MVVFNQMSCVTIARPLILHASGPRVCSGECPPSSSSAQYFPQKTMMKASILTTQTCLSVPKVLQRPELAPSTYFSRCPPLFVPETLPLSSFRVCQPTTVPLLPLPPCLAEPSAFIPALCICSQASSEDICRAARRRWLPSSEIKHWIMSPAPKLSCCASHPASPPPQPAPLK